MLLAAELLRASVVLLTLVFLVAEVMKAPNSCCALDIPIDTKTILPVELGLPLRSNGWICPPKVCPSASWSVGTVFEQFSYKPPWKLLYVKQLPPGWGISMIAVASNNCARASKVKNAPMTMQARSRHRPALQIWLIFIPPSFILQPFY